ncbi:Cyanovirin-N [Mycena albidolilacea]|uniref:Cyanovirin-N n=1 Tax=Mycena albidolilacea TaxID=1033008 RepID=A0AAD7EFH9_9AGAR|nr:Cyanovirin-N [Mycena albidolilacea]
MKTTLLSSAVFAMCTFSAFGAPVEEITPTTNVERAADGGFVATCTNTSVNISNVVLTTTCRNSVGGLVTSSISLNSCIANANGQLVARFNGGFSASCPGVTFIGTGTTATLIGQCHNNGGTLVTSSIDLNVVFTNNNGLLTCP